jgi:hypothetical protein
MDGLGDFFAQAGCTPFRVRRRSALFLSIEYVWWLVFRTVPRRLLTIGELAREAAGCSFAKLAGAKECGPSDRWFALTAILRAIAGHRTAITRQTTFFANHGG